MKALGWWLMLVGSLRLASVWFGFFDIWALRLAVFSNATMTEVHGRTFGVWTLLTCTLCFLCAFNLENKPLYLATFLSFIYAFSHFLTEYLIYQTMAIANLTTVSVFAGLTLHRVVGFLSLHRPRQAPHEKNMSSNFLARVARLGRFQTEPQFHGAQLELGSSPHTNESFKFEDKSRRWMSCL